MNLSVLMEKHPNFVGSGNELSSSRFGGKAPFDRGFTSNASLDKARAGTIWPLISEIYERVERTGNGACADHAKMNLDGFLPYTARHIAPPIFAVFQTRIARNGSSSLSIARIEHSRGCLDSRPMPMRIEVNGWEGFKEVFCKSLSRFFRLLEPRLRRYFVEYAFKGTELGRIKNTLRENTAHGLLPLAAINELNFVAEGEIFKPILCGVIPTVTRTDGLHHYERLARTTEVKTTLSVMFPPSSVISNDFPLIEVPVLTLSEIIFLAEATASSCASRAVRNSPPSQSICNAAGVLRWK